MLPRLNYVFDRKKNRKVEICVYLAGKRRYLATGVSVPENAKYRNGVISGCSSAPALNKTLTTAMSILQEQLQKQIATDSFDIHSFSLAVTFNSDNFIDWALKRAESANIRHNTYLSHKVSLLKFKQYGIVNFTDITSMALNKAISAMVADGMRPTTISIYYGSARAYIKEAIKEKLLAVDPHPEVVIPKGKSKSINYLTREELAIVENAELDGLNRQACDMFLFACYTGLAYSDLVKIKKGDILMIDGKPYIQDKRQKTGGEYKLRLLPKAMAILERNNYNLNLMPNSNANHRLSGIEKGLKLRKHLTMHVGRHTFATLALSSGVRIETVSRMLAHANITTTQIYAKVLQSDVDKGFDILEGV